MERVLEPELPLLDDFDRERLPLRLEELPLLFEFELLRPELREFRCVATPSPPSKSLPHEYFREKRAENAYVPIRSRMRRCTSAPSALPLVSRITAPTMAPIAFALPDLTFSTASA